MAVTQSTIADLLTLGKVRVNALVVATTAGGYAMAAPPHVDLFRLVVTCAGTALVAGGAAAINQVDERDTDRLMVRTRLRPVAAERLSAAQGRTIAYTLAAAGLLLLFLKSDLTAALLALTTFVIYSLVYTPLKRRTSLSTIVGAVPGALPPLIGWAAAGGALNVPAPWALFLIMFIWQLPHFLAIAWIYRDDYGRAGLKMLSVVDATGGMAGRQATLWAASLVLASLLPAFVGLTGPAYIAGALVLGAAQFTLALRFGIRRSDDSARVLFYGSILYLPLLWGLMVWTHVTARQWVNG